MKVLLLNKNDKSGGAARAVFRLHKALRDNSVDSKLRVHNKESDDTNVIGTEGFFNKGLNRIKEELSALFMKLQRQDNHNPHSPALFPSGLINEINNSDFDVVQLNWIGSEFLSVEDIGRINKPLVWRLSDMWPFCGSEHYVDDGPKARWREGYNKTNRSQEQSGFDIDRLIFRRKVKCWDSSMHIVTPSKWMASCVKSSFLLKNNPVSIIPTPLDMHRYKPWDKMFSREVLGLPKSKKLLLFGAIGGTKNLRKGSDLLISSLKKISSMEGIEGVIFGESMPLNEPDFNIPIHWLGKLNDDISLSLVYSAADLMAIPSRQDNLPQTAIEAQACGCPIVAFKTSGMPDALEHMKTGYLAEAFDTEDFLHGIEIILKNNNETLNFSKNARKRATKLWSRGVIVRKYLEVYRNISENKF